MHVKYSLICDPYSTPRDQSESLQSEKQKTSSRLVRPTSRAFLGSVHDYAAQKHSSGRDKSHLHDAKVYFKEA